MTEICEARKPKDPAVIAEVDGEVEILNERKRGKRTIVVRSQSGIEREHMVPAGKRFLVHTGDHVEAGQALVDGPLVPHDILRVSGEEAVQQYLLHEIQQVYRIQKVEINDKHCEVIIARMLRKVMRHSNAVAPYTAKYMTRMPRRTSMLVAASIPALPAANRNSTGRSASGPVLNFAAKSSTSFNTPVSVSALWSVR